MVFNSQQLNDEEKGKRSDTFYKKNVYFFVPPIHIFCICGKKEIVSRAVSSDGNFATFAPPFFSPLLYSVQFTAVTHNRPTNTKRKYRWTRESQRKMFHFSWKKQKRCFASTGDLEIIYDLPVCVCYASCDKIVLKTLAFLHRYTQKQGSAQR